MKTKWLSRAVAAFGGLSFFFTAPAALDAQTQVLHSHVPAVVKSLQSLERFPGTNHLSLAIGLPLRNQVALSNLLQQIYDPASPNYRHYLTPEQFTERFGPTEADYQAVTAYASANGMRVTTTHPNRVLLDVSGSVADVERALHVTMRTYQHPTENRTFYAPDTEPSLDLAVPVLHISGLNNYSLPRPRFVINQLTDGWKVLPNAGSGPTGGYMGNDFRAAYVPDSLLNGSGQIVGLLQFDGYIASDITYYESHAGLPNVTLQNVLIDGASGLPSGNGGEVEVSLDIEMVISMATNVSKVLVYEAPNRSPFVDLLNRMATDNLAKQLSCSWYVPNGAAEPAADLIFQQMAAQGQSFFSASGDSDAFTGLIPFPGDTPYITQVGGTTLTTTGPGGSWISETVWNRGNGSGSGGGISTQYPIPGWQTNVSMAGNQGSTTMRNIPDVALTAENVYVRADGADRNVGGTSCAAPLWAGFAALINQQAAATGKPPIGFVNPAIYAIGMAANYTSVFHDTTTGNNTSGSSPAKFYAVAGYDLCTGWGTPAGQKLIDALAPPIIVTLPPSATEGDGLLAGAGHIQLPAAQAVDVAVALNSGDPAQVSVPASVTVPAGQTNAAFDLTILDDGILDGTQIAIITASVPGLGTASGSMTIFDKETAALQVSMSTTVTKGQGAVPGTVQVSAPVAASVTVALTSDTTNLIQVPASVVIPTGQTSAVFTATILTDGRINGGQTVNVTAHVQNWTDGVAAVTVQDDLHLTVTLPVSAWENAGVVADAGSIRISGTMPSSLIISLASGNSVKLTVPSSVTIPAGQISNTFNLTLVDNSIPDGHQNVTVTASATGFTNGSASMLVLDDESPTFPSNPRPGNFATNVPATSTLMWDNGTANEQVLNGGFELGTMDNWKLATNSSSGHFLINNGTVNPPSPDGPLPPFAGGFSALGTESGPGIFYMYQDVSIPSGATSATLNWAHRVRNFYSSFSSLQQFQVRICDINNNVLATPFTTSPGDPLLGNWVQKSYDLTSFAGTTVRLMFWVNPGSYYLDVHVDSVNVQTSSPGIAGSGIITNDVYFGTDPTPGPTEFQSSTTNSSWTPPLLAPLTTYYWQIVAHRIGSATGAVWQFTTAGIDHFTWATILSPQLLNQSFSATITAKDAFNTTVSNFTGTASLQCYGGGGASAIIEDFESGIWPHSPWVSVSGSMLGTISSAYAHDGNYGLSDPEWMYRSDVSLGRSGDNFSWWVRPGTGRAYLGFGASSSGCWSVVAAPNTSQFILQNDAGYSFLNVVTNSQTWQAGKWYKVAVQFSSTSTVTCNLYDSDGTTLLNTLSYSNVTGLPGGIAMRSFGGFALDTIVSGGSAANLPFSPTNTGNFVGGVWSGGIAVQQPATNVVLRASDGNNHSGTSNPFDVGVMNDVSVKIMDLPHPVSVGANLTYSITVANTGPLDATGVIVTNSLPANATFVSATSSQGTCSHFGSVVTCILGVVPGGTNATIAVVVTPTIAGVVLTNVATVARAETDAYLGNNTATALTPVTTPAISIADSSCLEGNVGTTNMIFGVTLAVPSAQTITVNYATTNGTAVAGKDYLSASGIVTFPAGVTNQNIAVAVIGNTAVESNKTLLLNLSNPVNGTLGRPQAAGTILNDDGLPGQVDHFSWNTILSPQLVSQPFSATITALDYFNNVVTNFNGPVGLSGVTGSSGSGQLVTFDGLSGSGLPVPAGYGGLTWSNFSYLIGNSSPNSGYYAGTISPPNVAFNLNGNPASINSTGQINFVSAYLTAAWNDNLQVQVQGYGGVMLVYSNTYTLSATTATLVNFNYLGVTKVGFTSSGGTPHPGYVGSGTHFAMDNVVISGSAASPVSIVPTNSSSFANGVWTGNITVQSLVTNVVLCADDGNGHSGLSNPFDMAVTNDISINVVDSPHPVSVGANLTYTLTIANTGPLDATGVIVTNFLPANATFVSATSSQGTCSHFGSVVTCNLGVVPGGTNATIAVVVTPTIAEVVLTNVATVSRAETDAYLGNNTATALTPVTTPAISIADSFCLEGNVGTTNIIFGVTLAVPSAQTITVNYATTIGTAIAGSDYVSTNGVLTFPPGSTNATIMVAVIGDTLIESNEVFFVNLSNPVNGKLGRAHGVGTILNDDGLPGQVDHFVWNPIASPQLAGQPFAATITAKDVFDTTVSNFIGRVGLSGQSGSSASGQLITFDDLLGNGLPLPVGYNGLTWSNFYYLVGSSNPNSGYAAGTISPPNVAFNSYGRPAFITSTGQFHFASAYLTAAWNDNLQVQVQGYAGATLLYNNTYTLSTTNPTLVNFNYHGVTEVAFVPSADTQFAMDNVVVGNGADYPIVISPTNTGNFVAGVWTGNVTVQQPATNNVLQANDGNGHSGLSNPFDTAVTNDLSIRIADSPHPVSVGANLAYTLTVANTGPLDATGVMVTNVLPANATFVSATSSQGACAQSGGIVTCILGVVPGGTNATIAVVVTPTIAGVVLTNVATVARAETDAYLGNNTATALTPVTTPAISIADSSCLEGNVGTTNMIFGVTLAVPSAQTITVNYATSNGTAIAGKDYISASGIVAFPAGVTNQNIAVAVIGNTAVESNKTLLLNLSNPVNGTLGRPQAAGTILNDDGLPWQVDHFGWATIPSPQVVNQPFSATITALDYFNNVVTNFNGTAGLSASRNSGLGEIFRANFEGGLQGFTVSNTFGLGNGLWHLSTGRAAQAGHSPPISIYYGWGEGPGGGGTYSNGVANEGIIISPVIDLGSAAAPLTLSFNCLIQSEPGTAWDHATVEISTNNGASYAVICGNNQGGVLFGTDSGGLWITVTNNISSYAGRQIRLRLHFNTIDSGANSYEGWYVDDLSIFSGNTSTPIAISPANSGSFINGVWSGNVTVQSLATNVVLRADDGNGHSGLSNPFGVTYSNQPPIILLQPTNQTVSAGFDATFSMAADGSPTISYFWLRNSVLISGATNSTYTATNVQLTDSGSQFNCVVSNAYGTTNSRSATLIVLAVPPSVTQQPLSQTVTLGGTASFSVTAIGSLPLNYFWMRNGTAIAGATNSAYTTNNVQFADSGSTFSCVVSNAYGTIVSSNATLTVTVVTGPVFLTGNYLYLPIQTNGVFLATNTGAKYNSAGAGGASGVDFWEPGAPVYNWIVGVDGTNYVNGSSPLVRGFSNVTVNNLSSGGLQRALINGGVIPGLSFTREISFATNSKVIRIVDTLQNTGATALTNVVTLDTTDPDQDSAAATNPSFATLNDVVSVNSSNDIVVATGPSTGLSVGFGSDSGLQIPSAVGFNNINAYSNLTVVDPNGASGDIDINLAQNYGTLAAGQSRSVTWYMVFDVSKAAVTNAFAALGMSTNPPVITMQPTNQTVATGNTATFSVAASGTPPLIYQWNFNGTNIDGATNTTLTLTNAQLNQAGSYAVLVTNSLGSAISSDAVLTVVLMPPGIATPPSSITNVAGTTAIFTVKAVGSMPLSSQWRKNGSGMADGGNVSGSTATNLTLSNVQDIDAADYTVVITNVAGSITSSVASLTVIDPPVITAQPANQILAAGRTAIFSATASGTTPLNYRWLKVGSGMIDGGNISGAATATLALVNVSLGDMAGYSVVVTNFAGSVTSLVATLTVAAPPSIATQPASRTNIVGTAANFTVTASGTPPLSCQWNFNGTNIAGATNTTLTLPNIQLTNAGNYAVLVTNNYGSILSSNALLTVLALPPTIIMQPTNRTVAMGGVASFSVTVTGSTPLSYQWSFNGTNIIGATATNFTIVNVQPTNAGIYSVAVTNAYGSTNSANAVLTVNPPPSSSVPVITGFSPASGIVGTIVTISGAKFSPVASNNLVRFGGFRSIVLAAGSNSLTVVVPLGATRVPLTVTVNGMTAYANTPFLVTYPNGSTKVVAWGDNTDGQTNVPPGLTNVVAIAAGACADHNLALKNDGTVVVWGYTNLGQAAVPSGLTNAITIAGGYGHNLALKSDGTVTAWGLNSYIGTTGQTNVPAGLSNVVAISACWYSSMALKADGRVVAWGYSGNGQTNLPAGLSNVVAIAGAPCYSLALKVDGTVVAWGTNYNTPGGIPVQLMDPPSGLSNVVAIAAGYNHCLALKADGTVVVWGENYYGQTNMPAGLTNVVAIAAGSDNNLVLKADGTMVGWGFYIPDHPPAGLTNVVAIGAGYYHSLALVNDSSFRSPVITSQPTNQTAIVGGTATFSVTASGTPTLSYQWKKNGTNLFGATGTNFTIVNVQTNDAGIYSVAITNVSGSINSSNATLVVNPLLYFVWNQVPSPRFANAPFTVVIQAQNLTNGTVTNFTDTVVLLSTNGVLVNPAVSGNFVQGVWTGAVTIAQTVTNLVLQATDKLGDSGLANPINVISLPALTSVPSGGILYIFWPVNPPGFVLETTAGLSPASWVPVATSPFPIGDQNLLPIQMSVTNAFYRLRFNGQ